MRTRNSETSKSIPPPTRTPPSSKPPGLGPAAKTISSAAEFASLKAPETRRASAARAKNEEAAPSLQITSSSAALNLELSLSDSKPAVGEATVLNDATQTTGKAKVGTRKVVRKVVRRVVKRIPGRKSTSGLGQTAINEEFVKSAVEEASVVEVADSNDPDGAKEEETVGESAKSRETVIDLEEPAVEKFGESHEEKNIAIELNEAVVESAKEVHCNIGIAGESTMQVVVLVPEVDKFYKDKVLGTSEKGEEVNEVEQAGKVKNVDDKEEPKIEEVKMDENIKDELHPRDVPSNQDEYGGYEGYEEYGDRVDFEDHGDDDFVEEDPEEPPEETKALEEERKELTAVAKERKMKKEYEIFVGGFDKDATEHDLRKVFERIGEVVEVRFHRDHLGNRNKGYAFVKFAKKEHVKRALSEMKNPVIRGKRCMTAPSEDNDMLFLGNICNTWTKEAIRQKLKDYGVEGVENITLVPDAQHEGRSRGFAFLEFSCHIDAMHAYKRLQKPDVVFGHAERTAKVAFAEPIREPDPEVMAKVKTIFLDGLPPHWDEDHVRELLKGYGDIVRIVLARNMSTAKRKDFGFVDFSTHDAAVACIEGMNKTEKSDGNSKAQVKARLSNPLPKTQAVKGEMAGGFRIGRIGNETFSRFGRGFGRFGSNNRVNFQRGRHFYPRGYGRTSRMGPNDYEFNNQYDMYRGRQMTMRGGRRGPVRDGYPPVGRDVGPAGPSRSNVNRPWYDTPERGHGNHFPSWRQVYPPEEVFDRPFVGRRYDDPYFSDDSGRGMKRPFYMTDHDHPDYRGPSRMRPRLDYADPASSFRGSRYRDAYGPDNDPYPHDYYGSDYGAYPSYYGSDRSYRGGYYY